MMVDAGQYLYVTSPSEESDNWLGGGLRDRCDWSQRGPGGPLRGRDQSLTSYPSLRSMYL